MQRREDIKVKPGFEYDHFFPKAKLITIPKKKGATVADTMLLIPSVVRDTLFHTKRFAKEVIQDETLEKTCRNLWEFVYTFIAYKKDEDGKEQVRSPARTWHDRGNNLGVDCDCYTVFISSILSNLNIKHKFRITKYGQDHFQHIYPIVPTNDGGYITIDCVVKTFDYEEPYTEKKDTDMDLEYLNGVTFSDRSTKIGDSQDFMGLMSEQEALSELGKIIKRKSSGGGSGGSRSTPKQKGKIKQVLKKGLHVTNRVNPATVALRNGILAGMKLNFLQIGSNLRYAYLTEDQAKQKGLVMDRYHKLKSIKDKLEKIFYGAGGKPENLKKAILTGHGNKNKEVPINGLGYPYENVDGLHEDMSLSQLLGREIYASENIEGMEGFGGFGELGEPVTAASITAASTVLTTIAALIKNVGSVFPKKNTTRSNTANKSNGNGDSGSGSSDSGVDNNNGGNNSSGDNTNDSNSSSSTSSDNSSSGGGNESDAGNTTAGRGINTNTPTTTNSSTPANSDNSSSSDGGNDNTESGSSQSRSANGSADDPKNKVSFWEDNKKWIKPVGIGVGSIGLLALIYQLFKPKHKPALNGAPKNGKGKSKKNLLNGITSKPKKGGHIKTKKHRSNTKKKMVTLL